MRRCEKCDRLLVHDYDCLTDCTWCWLEEQEAALLVAPVFACGDPEGDWIRDVRDGVA